MTREEILAMKPGRELDCLVAEHIFGYWWADGPKYDYDGPCEWERILVPPAISREEMKRYNFPPKGKIPKTFFVHEEYSTDIAAAWEVLIHIGMQGQVGFSGGDDWFCEIDSGWHDDGTAKNFKATGYTAPEAICRAALLAVMTE